MYTIATLEEFRRRLNLGAGDRGSDDDLLRALGEASHLIELATGRRFCPRLATLDATPDRPDPRSLVLQDDLLEAAQCPRRGRRAGTWRTFACCPVTTMSRPASST